MEFSQQHQQRFLPTVPQVPLGHQPLPSQQSATSSGRNATVVSFFLLLVFNGWADTRSKSTTTDSGLIVNLIQAI